MTALTDDRIVNCLRLLGRAHEDDLAAALVIGARDNPETFRADTFTEARVLVALSRLHRRGRVLFRPEVDRVAPWSVTA